MLLLIFVAIAFAVKRIILEGRWNNTRSMFTGLKFTLALQHVIVREGLGLCVRKIVQSSPLSGGLGPDFPSLVCLPLFPSTPSFPITCVSSPCQRSLLLSCPPISVLLTASFLWTVSPFARAAPTK